jgi:hypothetical protein
VIVEIRKVDDFAEIKNSGKGYVLITDEGTGNHTHIVCSNVRVSYFREKVILNGGKNSKYYCSNEIEALRRICPIAVICDNCKAQYDELSIAG